MKHTDIDYLELKLMGQDLKDKLVGIGVNSLTRSMKTENYYFIIQYRAEFSKGLYIIYDVFIIENEKRKHIASINWIKNEQMSKKGVFISFSGEFWHNYSMLELLELMDGMKYNYNKYLWNIYRLDYRIDLLNVKVYDTYINLEKESIKKSNINIRADCKTNKMTYYKLEFVEDLIRVYDKKLDIIDKGKTESYEEYMKYEGPITRIELQLSRKKFSRKLIQNIEDIYDYGQNALFKKLKKYYKYEAFKNNQYLKIQFDDTKIYLQKRDTEILKFNKNMYESYFKKLLNSRNGKLFLKNNFFNYEKQVFNNLTIKK